MPSRISAGELRSAHRRTLAIHLPLSSLHSLPSFPLSPWTSPVPLSLPLSSLPSLSPSPPFSSEVIPTLLGKSPPPHIFPIFSQGKRNADNCRRLPLTCTLLEALPEATMCKHGEVKFIMVPPGAHVPPHTGQTNTVLEVMVGLNLGDRELSIRVAEETR